MCEESENPGAFFAGQAAFAKRIAVVQASLNSDPKDGYLSNQIS